jgi:hypothetical protein
MAGAPAGIAQALQAYQQAIKGGGTPRPLEVDGAGAAFAQLVRGAIEKTIETGMRSEQLSVAAIQDRADIGDGGQRG